KTIVQQVCSSIAAYYMQCVPLVFVCDDIALANRRFLWGASENKKKMSFVGWDKVALPKQQGGLGIRKSRQANVAALAKLNWRLTEDKNSYWAASLKQSILTIAAWRV
ncbi:hypothetical protein ACH5RR_021005, partial [Cinchona calisaya]